MKYLYLFLVLCSTISFNTAETLLHSVEDYYWRDYRGLIPKDAIAGGTSQNGQKTYIAQINMPTDVWPSAKNEDIHKLEIIPAVIKHGDKNAIGAYRGRIITSNENSNVKVLCSQYASRYTWHNETNIFGPGCRFVVGGQEILVPLYIGKAVYNGQTIFGKVFSDDLKQVFVPYEGGELVLQKYTILTYCH